MEAKKNPSLDFNKDRTLLRILGVASVLMFCYIMFSFTVYEKKKKKVAMQMVSDDAEVIENTKQEKKPEPPKVVELKLVDDKVEVKEEFKAEEFDEEEEASEKSEEKKDKPKEEEAEDNQIYENVSNSPKFKGGEDKQADFFAENLKYPEAERDNEIEGIINVIFVIEKNGTVSDVTTDGKGNKAFQNAAIDLIKQTSGRWIPGSQRDKPTRVKVKMPIEFSLE